MTSFFYNEGLRQMNSANVTFSNINSYVKLSNITPDGDAYVLDAADMTFTSTTGANISGVAVFSDVLKDYKDAVRSQLNNRAILFSTLGGFSGGFWDAFGIETKGFYVGSNYTGRLTEWITEQLLTRGRVHAKQLMRRAKRAGLDYPLVDIIAAAEALGFFTNGRGFWLELPGEHPWRSQQ